MTVEAAVKLFLEARLGIVSPQTSRWYAARLGRLADFLAKEIDAVTLSDLRAWRASLIRQQSRWEGHAHKSTEGGGLSPRTIDGHLRAGKRFFRWLVEEGHLTSDPARRLERPRLSAVPPKWLRRHEAAMLLEAASRSSPRDHAIIRLFLNSGMRLGELVGLTVGDLTLDRCSAWVVGKGNKRRRVFFDATTAATLVRYVGSRSQGPLWIGATGQRLGEDGVRQVVRRVSQRAGLQRIGPHRLRHTFAYWSLKRGVDPDIVRRQMGHADLKTLYDNYVRWIDDDLERAFAGSWLDGSGAS